MQNEFTVEQNVLDENGVLIDQGYARSLILNYSRDQIKSSKLKIKEWDYYLITSDDIMISLTMADNGYMGLISAIIIDLKNKKIFKKNHPLLFPLGKLNAPPSSKEGSWMFSSKNFYMNFQVKNDIRHIQYCHKEFYKKGRNAKSLTVDVVLKETQKDSIMITTPFAENEKYFYYNQKINCLETVGRATFGDIIYDFSKETNALSVLDWGRGVWPYTSTWYWSSLSTYLDDGSTFGFNLGYGFGVREKASENMLFYNGNGHKLENVEFIIPKKKEKFDYLSPWTVGADNNRLNLTFTPIIDRSENLNALVLATNQHQVFGYFNGTAVLDCGTKIELVDKIGFAERVYNKW